MSCQKIQGAPFLWTLTIKKENFEFISGKNFIIATNENNYIEDKNNINSIEDCPFPRRFTCKYCQGRIADEGIKY